MPESKIKIDSIDYPVAPERKAKDYLASYKGWAFSAITMIAQSVSTIPVKLYKRKSDGDVEEVDAHPAMDALRYTNDFMTYQQLREITEVYRCLLGESVWLLLRSGNQPTGIIPLRPDWIDVVPDGRGGIKEYIYHVGGQFSDVTLQAKDVLFFKTIDPLNIYRGYGEIRAAAMELDIDNYSDEWNRNFFFNSAMPSLFLSTNADLTSAEKKRFVAKFQSGHGGIKNAHKVSFMSGGELKVQPVSANMQELDFQASKDRIRDKILAVFHISKSNIGMTDDVNRANSEAQEQRFMKSVVKPRLVSFVNYLNEFFLPEFENSEGLFFNFEDPVTEDQESKINMLKAASQEGWMSVNEIREEIGLDPVDAGDYIYKPLNITPIANTAGDDMPMPSEQSGGNQEDGNSDDMPEGKGFWGKLFKRRQPKNNILVYKTSRKKKRLIDKLGAPIPSISYSRKRQEVEYKAIKSSIKSLIVAMIQKSRMDDRSEVITLMTGEDEAEYMKKFSNRLEVFESLMKQLNNKVADYQETIVLENLKKYSSMIENGKPIKADSLLFSIRSENDRMYKLYKPFLLGIAKQFGNETLEQVLKSEKIYETKLFDVGARIVTDFLSNLKSGFINEVNQTTKDSLIKTITEGIKNNESVADIAKRIKDVYNGFKTWRNETIAKTQVLQAANFGTYASYEQSDGIVAAKQWLSAEDSKVRQDHQDVNMKIVPTDEPFIVGGKKMMYPLDPNGGADQICNCRCTTLPVTRTQLRSIERQNMILKDAAKKEIYNVLADKLIESELESKRGKVEVLKHEVKSMKKEKEAAAIERDSIIKSTKEIVSNLVRDSIKEVKNDEAIKQKEITAINKQKAESMKEALVKRDNKVKTMKERIAILREEKATVENSVAELKLTEFNIKKNIDNLMSQANEKAKLLIKKISGQKSK